MEYVTYLFGAGASCGEGLSGEGSGLPMVKYMERVFRNRYSAMNLEDFSNSRQMNSHEEFYGIPEDSRVKLLNLYGKILKHYSDVKGEDDPTPGFPKAGSYNTIDTYLKFLFHKNAEAFEELRLCLDQFFILEQLFWNKNDLRYLNLLSTISDLNILPDNVNFITWNYDFLLQRTSDIFNLRDHNYTGVHITSPGLISSYPAPGNFFIREKATSSRWDLLHLNGRCGVFTIEKEDGALNSYLTDVLIKCLDFSREQILDFVIQEYPKHHRFMTFAWEGLKYNHFPPPVELIPKAMESTTILVIIGYSFPFFNREVDGVVLGSAKSLRKIIYQQPDKDVSGDFLRGRFGLGDVEIVDVHDCSQFYVPVEL